MDVNLFSKCIKDLILENDRVEIPFLGVFIAEMQPAAYSDKQTTINPPYRKMSFHKEEVSLEQGSLLLGKVMRESGVSLEQAGVELGWCLSRLSSELEGRKSCKLPGLGMMKANSRNEFFFVPDDGLEIWPDGVGFEPISIRVSENPVQARDEVEVAEPAPVSEEVPAPEEAPVPGVRQEQRPEIPAAPSKPEHRHHRHHRHHGSSAHDGTRHRGLWITLIVAAVMFALFAAASCLFTEQMSPVLDRLLYNKEELELLRYFGGR
ncbi:MAG: hypothetical protein K6G79_07055 [Bacteroidales bacterium]|nr:hypothetical protein [Bacteroidales bacterium]